MSTTAAAVSFSAWLMVSGPNFNAVYGPLPSPPGSKPTAVCEAYKGYLSSGLREAFELDMNGSTKLTLRIGPLQIDGNPPLKFDCVLSTTRPPNPSPIMPWPGDKR